MLFKVDDKWRINGFCKVVASFGSGEAENEQEQVNKNKKNASFSSFLKRKYFNVIKVGLTFRSNKSSVCI